MFNSNILTNIYSFMSSTMLFIFIFSFKTSITNFTIKFIIFWQIPFVYFRFFLFIIIIIIITLMMIIIIRIFIIAKIIWIVFIFL
jgi:hypothetical protein